MFVFLERFLCSCPIWELSWQESKEIKRSHKQRRASHLHRLSCLDRTFTAIAGPLATSFAVTTAPMWY